MNQKARKGAAAGWSIRLPLAVLQLMFMFLVSSHAHLTDVTEVRPLLILGVLSLAALTLPTSLLETPWVISGVTLLDTAMLLKLTVEEGAVEPWQYLGYVMMMLVAGLSGSRPQVVGLGVMLCAVYGGSLYRYGTWAHGEMLLIPVLLVMGLVFERKAAVVHEALDQTAEHEVADRARSEALRDALTGLPNRAQFLEQVARAIQCGKNNRDFVFAILFIDLDGFKPINDGLGHKAGDAVLREMAKRLQACLRKGDLVARFGGDEFTLLVHNVTRPDDAVRVAERVLRKVKDPIDVGRKQAQVGASIGIALSTNIHERPEDLIRDADLAMYRAKAQGKGQYAISDQLKDTKVPEGVRDQLLKQASSQG